MSEDDSGLRERISVRAYYFWVSEGCLSGLEQDYWYRAESQERSGLDPGLQQPPPAATPSRTSVVFSPERNRTEAPAAQVLGEEGDNAAELDPCAAELEMDSMAKQKKGWFSNILSALGSAKPSTAEPPKVRVPSASAGISSGAGTAAKAFGMAETENLATPSAPATAAPSESLLEAEKGAAIAAAELARPVGAAADTHVPKPKKTSALAGLRAEISSNALFLHDFGRGAGPTCPVKGMIATIEKDEYGAEYLTLANGAANAQSAGETGGYSLKVPDEVERAASGHRIVVRAVARATGGGNSRFAIAYSTNEVGNSGWRWFPVGGEWSAIAFEYAVRPMIKGNGDFIGVLAEPIGKPGVDVCCISVEVATKAVAT